jgi:hypothetical protein
MVNLQANGSRRSTRIYEVDPVKKLLRARGLS